MTDRTNTVLIWSVSISVIIVKYDILSKFVKISASLHKVLSFAYFLSSPCLVHSVQFFRPTFLLHSFWMYVLLPL